MITRRKFVTGVSLSTFASALPFRATAQAKRVQCDLVITALHWSDDYGGMWHNDPVPQDASVLFRATIKNIGDAASPARRGIKVKFRVNEGSGWQTVGKVKHMGGLAVGEKVKLQSDDGKFGDSAWFPNLPGASTVVAIVDYKKKVNESDESNNRIRETIEVEAPMPVVVANDSSASTQFGTPVVIDVLANDVAPAGYALVVAAVQSPTDQGGSAVITPDSRFVEYTPPVDFSGEDSFTYDNRMVPV